MLADVELCRAGVTASPSVFERFWSTLPGLDGPRDCGRWRITFYFELQAVRGVRRPFTAKCNVSVLLWGCRVVVELEVCGCTVCIT